MTPLSKSAADLIIQMHTLPPQIDYIPPSDMVNLQAAEDLVDALPAIEKQEVVTYILDKMDEYYRADEKGISPAYLDSLF
jgi:hypothetical protein